jgi:sulfotransferase family protein
MTGTGSPRVLYIGGMGRSGSTLLQAMLGQLTGFVAAGELRYIWQRGPIDDVVCSCGEVFSRCPFWIEVGQRAFGGWDRLNIRDVVALQQSVDRHRYLPAIITQASRSRFAARLGRYQDLIVRLYDALAAVAGASVIVDSTKDPPHAFILRCAFGDRLRVAHLVRDSRGVAYSWTRRVQRPEVARGGAYMEQVRPSTMALKWMDYNLLFHLLALLGSPTVLLRYEDMVQAPGDSLRRLIRLAGEPPPTERLPGESGSVEIRPEHTLSGNPLRFTAGQLSLRADERWRDDMPVSQRRLVSAITAPLLAAYGYTPRRRLRSSPPGSRGD